MDLYLQPSYFMNFQHPAVQTFIQESTDPDSSIHQQMIDLYYAVRDGFRYDPYDINLSHTTMQASHIVQRSPRKGYCIEKSNLFAACCRAIGFPTRLGFANVRNHIGTEKLEEKMGTDELVFHGYTEVFVNGNWIKATPVFNRELCQKLGVEPLEFDGQSDSIFQEFDQKGGQFMEYLVYHGTFHDVPHDKFLLEMVRTYPKLFPGVNPQKDILPQIQKLKEHVSF
ncbi:MAG: transglutaminase-like domain-containing protein [Bacteroidota bacterium]